jgi:hypothetical protein
MADSYVSDMLVDALPDELQNGVDNHRRAIARASRGRNLEFVISKSRRWTPGQIVCVGFRGGADALYEKIAEAASGWTRYGNIKLEFKSPETGQFHLWSPEDEEFRVQVRIGFDQAGYWSLVGTDSANPAITHPGDASMNFGGFAQQLPQDWTATVLHEFGHAFGFEHEHQHPAGVCESEFRWDDDSGYTLTTDGLGQAIADNRGRRPGIYTVLGAPPNRWPKTKVDFNLRELHESSALQSSAFDKNSIMKYYFGTWMFRSGEQSPCFSQRNTTLSALDQQGFKEAYPV